MGRSGVIAGAMRLTRETPAAGVVVYQPATGFRYAVDAFWLAGFASEGEARTAADLGTGSGIVALLLAARGLDVVGVDVRAEWRRCWTASLAESGVTARFELGDVRTWRGGRFDVVVANPPYFPTSAGPCSPDPWKAAARTETTATLADFVRAALALADRACLVLPVNREAAALAVAREHGVGAPRRVHVGRKRALVELLPGAVTAEPERIDEPTAHRRYRLTGPGRSRA